jgi:hypothetical protein
MKMRLNPLDRCVVLSAFASLLLVVGCGTITAVVDSLPDIVGALTNAVPPVVTVTTNTPPVVTPPADKPATGGLTPQKIAHGAPETCRSVETPDSSSERTIDGVAFRIYELDSDKPIGRQAVKAKAIRVVDGQTVIDDFLLDSGQVAVWEYTNDGKDKGPVVRDNPAKLKGDSRIRYRCHARAAQ